MITTQRHEHARIQQQERAGRADMQWPRIGAACGLAFVVLQSVALGFMSSGGWLDPGAAPADIVKAFAGLPSRPLWIGAYLSVLAALCFIPFTARVATSLRRADVAAGWLPTTALAGGWLLVAAEVSGAGAITALLARAGHALSPAEALTLFDLAQALLFLFWAGGVIFLGAVAVLSLTRRVLPRWLGGRPQRSRRCSSWPPLSPRTSCTSRPPCFTCGSLRPASCFCGHPKSHLRRGQAMPAQGRADLRDEAWGAGP